MVERMPPRYREEMFSSIEDRLARDMPGRTKPSEIAYALNFILKDEFEKERGSNGARFSMNPIFVGQYGVDPDNPSQTIVIAGQGTEACSPLGLQGGIIGRAIRTGRDQYIPDVSQDPLHIACDKEMDEVGGTEIVLLSWSEPYSSGRFQGKRVPLGVLDVDLGATNAFSEDDVRRLRRIWKPYGEKIFPGEPSFEITPDVEGLYEFLSTDKVRKD